MTLEVAVATAALLVLGRGKGRAAHGRVHRVNSKTSYFLLQACHHTQEYACGRGNVSVGSLAERTGDRQERTGDRRQLGEHRMVEGSNPLSGGVASPNPDIAVEMK